MNKLVRDVAGGLAGEGGLYGFKHSGEPDWGSKFTNFMELICVHLIVIMALYSAGSMDRLGWPIICPDTASTCVYESMAYGSLGFKWKLSYTVDRYHAFQPYMLCYANT